MAFDDIGNCRAEASAALRSNVPDGASLARTRSHHDSSSAESSLERHLASVYSSTGWRLYAP